MTKYTIEHGSYYLRSENGDIRLMTDQVAMAYDTDTFVMMKHGSPEQIMSWYRENSPKVRPHINLAVVTFPRGYDVETINRVLANSGYLEVLLKSILGEA